MKKYCFGIDVGGTTVKMGLFTTEGELLDKWEIPTRKEDGGAYILNDVAASVEAKLAEKNIEKDDVAGAGIGVPGPTLDTGYVSICVNLGWKDKNPANELSELLSIPVKAGNDANVAALGEMWKGGGEGYLDVVLLTLGTGVGGGIIINGEIAPSHRGVGGELGHITVNPDELPVIAEIMDVLSSMHQQQVLYVLQISFLLQVRRNLHFARLKQLRQRMCLMLQRQEIIWQLRQLRYLESILD